MPIQSKNNKVVFLDRDGVINKRMAEGEYVTNINDFELLPTVGEAVVLLNRNGYKIYVISNQAGIGKGLMTDGDLSEIHRYMERQLEKYGAEIAGIYYCPHKADDYCTCRKPKPGMFHQAALVHGIDLSRAVFIGDDPRDEEAGRAAGCRTILMKSNGDLLAVIKSKVIQ